MLQKQQNMKLYVGHIIPLFVQQNKLERSSFE